MSIPIALLATSLITAPVLAQPDIVQAVEADYAVHLEALFLDFHRNPELSLLETRTAAVMAKELRAIGGIDGVVKQQDLNVPGAFFRVGGTPQTEFDAAKNGGAQIRPHHSPLFRVDAKASVTRGTQAMAVASLDLLKK